MILLTKKLKENAKLPEKKRESDEGYDIFACEPKRIFKGTNGKVSTGIACRVVDDHIDKLSNPKIKSYWLQIEGRSGLSAQGIFPIGGIIDSGYTGEISVVLVNVSESDFFVKEGDKIAQLVIREHLNASIEEVNDLGDSDRGDKGFGSSGMR